MTSALKNRIIKRVIGLTLAQAQKLYDNIRVVQDDSSPKIGDCAFRPDRLNVYIQNKKIIEADWG